MGQLTTCNNEFWGLRCDRPLGHDSTHSATKDGSLVVWIDKQSDFKRSETTEGAEAQRG